MQTPDGGTVSLDYHQLPPGKAMQDLEDDAPVIILLPGLTGGSHDTYVRYMVQACSQHGVRAVVFNSRGTSDGPVTSPQFYSASFTGDMRQVVGMVKQRYPQSELLAAGWSLGANILVRYLGEEGAACPISAAVSMCNPFDLAISDANFSQGFNRIYDKSLAQSLREIFSRHSHLFKDVGGEYDIQKAATCKSIREFDEAITRVSFGWPDVDAYYQGSGSCWTVPEVTIPLLCIQAADDPIAPEHAIPYKALHDNPNCILTVTPGGGHLGWVSGHGAPLGAPWATQAVVEWLTSVQLELLRSGRSSRLVEQLSQKAVEDVSSGGQQSNGNGSPRLVEQA
eukprot:jgi/Astpho2/961/e_gw1.00016.122.1_t